MLLVSKQRARAVVGQLTAWAACPVEASLDLCENEVHLSRFQWKLVTRKGNETTGLDGFNSRLVLYDQHLVPADASERRASAATCGTWSITKENKRAVLDSESLSYSCQDHRHVLSYGAMCVHYADSRAPRSPRPDYRGGSDVDRWPAL